MAEQTTNSSHNRNSDNNGDVSFDTCNRTSAEEKPFCHSDPRCTCLEVDHQQMTVIPKLALSLSGCGFLGVYHFGSIVCFYKHGRQFLERCDRFAGASAGSLVSAMLVTCPDKLEDSLTAWYTLADEILQKPLGALTPGYSLIKQVEEYVDGILPMDAHKTASGRLFISVTCRQAGSNSLVSEFETRESLLKHLIGSCYIPFYGGLSVSPLTKDGQFSDRRTITISPFSGEADISPEDRPAVFDWTVTLACQTVKVNFGNVKRGMQALFPPSLRVLEDYYKMGYLDTMKFLMRHSCFERAEGTPTHFQVKQMSLVAVLIKRVLSVFHCILATFKRLLCFFNRKRVHDDGALPFTVRQAGISDSAVSDFEGWDSWGEERKRQKTESEQRIEAYRHRLSTAREEAERAAAEESKNEINYFESLQPELKPVKKIVLKPKYSGGSSDVPLSPLNRFAVQSDINVYMSNVDTTSLGHLDDAPRPIIGAEDSFSPWETDEASLDVDSVLKEAKHKERQQRLDEQRRKQQEKQRVSNKHTLDVVKLS